MAACPSTDDLARRPGISTPLSAFESPLENARTRFEHVQFEREKEKKEKKKTKTLTQPGFLPAETRRSFP